MPSTTHHHETRNNHTKYDMARAKDDTMERVPMAHTCGLFR